MLHFLEGKIEELTPTYVVLNCSGTGYLLHISLNTYTPLLQKKEVRLLTQVTVNQMDYSQTAFGFLTEDERMLFKHLISVSGVGASSARMCISSYAPSELVQLIVSGNAGALKKVKGIGEKTAQRIIVDLKDKLSKAGGGELAQISLTGGNKNREEALMALVMLGFVRNQAEKAVDKAMQSAQADLSVEELIKQALKTL
jgi:Holliday junction DNA helicase RuvA